MLKEKVVNKLLSLKCQNEKCAGGHNFYINSDDVITISIFGVDLFFLDGFKRKFIKFSEIKDIEIYNTHLTFILNNCKNITVER